MSRAVGRLPVELEELRDPKRTETGSLARVTVDAESLRLVEAYVDPVGAERPLRVAYLGSYARAAGAWTAPELVLTGDVLELEGKLGVDDVGAVGAALTMAAQLFRERFRP